jgi:membrane-associated protease RseP (regulator of RpoE activity)
MADSWPPAGGTIDDSWRTSGQAENELRPVAAPVAHGDRYWLHAGLFLLTLGCATYAGAELVGRWLLYTRDGGWTIALFDGAQYALALLGFLTVHEFGHYFAARVHQVAVSLPYYIPSPFFFIPFNIGTFGAVIRIRQAVPSTSRLFDIGVSGPLAGFVASVAILVFALAGLPDNGYLLDLPGHEVIKQLIFDGRSLPARSPTPYPVVYVGQTPLFWILSQFFEGVPPMYEMYHYPLLFAGWLGLFFTALNLLPVGQLDGGHILYALVGPRWHGRLARGFVLLLLFSGSVGFVAEMTPLLDTYVRSAAVLSWILLAVILLFFLRRIFRDRLALIVSTLALLMVLAFLATRFPAVVAQIGYSGWFFWCLLIVLVIKVDHPPVLYPEPLTPARKLLGILSLVIFALCFSIRPIFLS